MTTEISTPSLLAGVPAPKLFYTIHGGVERNPCSVIVLGEMAMRINRELNDFPELRGVVCKIFGSIKEAAEVLPDSVALFDGDRCHNFSPLVSLFEEYSPRWTHPSRWRVVVGPGCGEMGTYTTRCAHTTIAIFAKRFSEEIKRGHWPWGQPRTALKRNRGATRRYRSQRRQGRTGGFFC